MPIGKYFGGSGEKVMAAMKNTYKDPEKAKEVFYAKANTLKDKFRKPFTSNVKEKYK